MSMGKSKYGGHGDAAEFCWFIKINPLLQLTWGNQLVTNSLFLHIILYNGALSSSKGD